MEREMRCKKWMSVSLACAISLAVALRADAPKQNWTHFVRIGAYGLSPDNAEKIVKDAQATHVFGIEVDNDIPGRYESFLDPTEKLAAIRKVAEKAHQSNNKAYVYIAGTECITANAEKSAHSVVKDHPDWLQRKITGEPAVFTGGAAFWIREGDEDVWISPYAMPWRKTYMERVRQIAATGIDGIYVDIPYWMTHFDGWEDTWASFDEFTVAAFKKQTGLDARKEVKLGDFSDANFRKWVDFRIATFTDFMREIRENARTANPQIMVIPEIYPGIEEEAVRVGADVYQLYDVVDAIAHEYEFGGGDHMAGSRSQLDWFLYQAGMLSFRGFAQGKATWLLNYSWDGDKAVDAREAMKTLAASEVMAGVNFWDAPGHSMGGSNDAATRTEIFKWIEKHEGTLYHPRMPMRPVGVYFSPDSRNYDGAHFLPSYRGTIVLLLQKHSEIQIVTPRTLGEFRGSVLILPDVSTPSDAERAELQRFVSRGGRLIVEGKDATGLAESKLVVRISTSSGAEHLSRLEKDFAKASLAISEELSNALPENGDLKIAASPFVVSHPAVVDGKRHVFFVNFSGIVPHQKVKPDLETGATVTLSAAPKTTLTFLPFLGEEQTISGEAAGGKMTFHLPAFDRGAVVWVNESK
jgi:endo-alpha-1,4-polygalactosaminidase (GH114 family)